MSDPDDVIRDIVSGAVKELIESKHLYQSEKLDLAPLVQILQQNDIRLRTAASAPNAKPREMPNGTPQERAAATFDESWKFVEEKPMSRLEPLLGGGAAPLSRPSKQLPSFSLPTINIQCAHCDGVLPPHNPVFINPHTTVYTENLRSKGVLVQVFVFPFMCQNCRTEPLLFMVRREGLKITLVGRSHFEDVAVPKYVPEHVRKFYTGAVIASNTGHPLAALFYLRTLIEQYMSSVVKPSSRLTGEELAVEYGRTLPSDFQSRYPSFKKIYEDASAAMHEAREDCDLFQNALADMEKHFEAKPFFMVRPALPTQ